MSTGQTTPLPQSRLQEPQPQGNNSVSAGTVALNSSNKLEVHPEASRSVSERAAQGQAEEQDPALDPSKVTPGLGTLLLLL